MLSLRTDVHLIHSLCLTTTKPLGQPLRPVVHRDDLVGRARRRWDNPSDRNRWDNPSDSIDAYSAYKILSHSELTMRAPKHELVQHERRGVALLTQWIKTPLRCHGIIAPKPLEICSARKRGQATL